MAHDIERALERATARAAAAEAKAADAIAQVEALRLIIEAGQGVVRDLNARVKKLEARGGAGRG